MVHRVKCGDEIFYVSSGHVRDALEIYSKADPDYADKVRQILRRGRLNLPNMREAEELLRGVGYLNFDGLTDGKLPATDHYFDGVFRGKRTEICGVRIIPVGPDESGQARM